MERKIGDTFEFEGRKLQVKESASNGCDGCFFYMKCSSITMGLSGECEVDARDDGKDVVFVEVQAQPQKNEEIKERIIGEVFEYEGKRLVVKETKIGTCTDCFFKLIGCTPQAKKNTGACSSMTRTDNKSVIFVLVTEESEKQQAEQPQDEQSQLNLCEILKHCPKGEKFWSPMFGRVVYHGIIKGEVGVTVESGVPMIINADGTITINLVTSPEVMLYPSREQRDWSKVKYEPKKERFDPKTLKPFDRVLVNHDDIWKVDFFSHICQYEPNGWCQCIGDSYYICIPYNDDTKYLIGTTDEAPEFYRYWED